MSSEIANDQEQLKANNIDPDGDEEGHISQTDANHDDRPQ